MGGKTHTAHLLHIVEPHLWACCKENYYNTCYNQKQITAEANKK